MPFSAMSLLPEISHFCVSLATRYQTLIPFSNTFSPPFVALLDLMLLNLTPSSKV
jgi:hypothetical protein